MLDSEEIGLQVQQWIDDVVRAYSEALCWSAICEQSPPYRGIGYLIDRLYPRGLKS